MKSDSLRSFLAVDLAPHARAQAAQLMLKLREQAPQGVRWVPEENLHLTLKFLGNIDPERIPRLVTGVSAKLQRVTGFELVLGGLGAFPNARRARVVWLGVRAGGAELARLARKLEAAAVRIGVERERRPFRTHLTLGRLREPGPLPLAAVPCPDGRPFFVEEVVLYESRLSPTGSCYVPLARLPLQTAEAQQTNIAPEI